MRALIEDGGVDRGQPMSILVDCRRVGEVEE